MTRQEHLTWYYYDYLHAADAAPPPFDWVSPPAGGPARPLFAWQKIQRKRFSIYRCMQGLRPFARALSAARRQIEWGMSPDGNDSDPAAQRARAALAARAAGFGDGVEGAAGGAAGARKGRAEATVEEMVLTPSPPLRTKRACSPL